MRPGVLALQGDGKILAAGYATSGTPDFALARYNRDGTLDRSFGTGVKVTTDFAGSGGVGLAVALLIGVIREQQFPEFLPRASVLRPVPGIGESQAAVRPACARRISRLFLGARGTGVGGVLLSGPSGLGRLEGLEACPC
jgi:hypothetical protein